MTTQNQMLHSFSSKTEKENIKVYLVLAVGALILGLGTGYGLSLYKTGSVPKATIEDLAQQRAADGSSAGLKDKKTFPDEVKGTLFEGGIEGEGSFHLERPGGVSQNVYLTSSTVDLTSFVGKKVLLWGKTYESEKAGWFMDVGYVEKIK